MNRLLLILKQTLNIFEIKKKYRNKNIVFISCKCKKGSFNFEKEDKKVGTVAFSVVLLS